MSTELEGSLALYPTGDVYRFEFQHVASGAMGVLPPKSYFNLTVLIGEELLYPGHKKQVLENWRCWQTTPCVVASGQIVLFSENAPRLRRNVSDSALKRSPLVQKSAQRWDIWWSSAMARHPPKGGQSSFLRWHYWHVQWVDTNFSAL